MTTFSLAIALPNAAVTAVEKTKAGICKEKASVTMNY